eukprot:9473934-Pyramimonas_sp.AAC.1
MAIPARCQTIAINVHASIFLRVRCKGAVFGKFQLSRGMQQGCSLSGLLFGLALDPWLRRVQRDLAP